MCHSIGDDDSSCMHIYFMIVVNLFRCFQITKIELQNQHQQLISMEGVDNPNTKMLLTKCINVLLAFLAVVLVFVSTISNVIGPLLNARFVNNHYQSVML